MAKAAAGRGSLSASMWAPRIKTLGPFALAAWALSPVLRLGTKREKKGEMLCPHCGGDLDNPELYRDLNFLVCPHCSEGITPIYDLGDYISHLVSQIDRVRGGRALGAEALDNVVEREAMLKLVRAVLTLVVRRRSSDLHVDASGEQRLGHLPVVFGGHGDAGRLHPVLPQGAPGVGLDPVDPDRQPGHESGVDRLALGGQQQRQDIPQHRLGRRVQQHVGVGTHPPAVVHGHR